jgi:hypothetical protein
MFHLLDVAEEATYIGFGLVIDVCVYTLFMFHDRTLSIRNWVLPITYYHLALLGIVCSVIWLFGHSPLVLTLLGLSGGIFITLLLYESVCDGIGKDPFFSLTNFVNDRFNRGGVSIFNPLILAVSWDAALSSPGIFTQVKEYSLESLMVGLIIIGLTIAAFTWLALLVARRLNRNGFDSAKKLAGFSIIGKWIQCSVIGSFGVSAYWLGFTAYQKTPSNNEVASLIIASLLTTLVLWTLRRKLWTHGKKEAETAILGQRIDTL